MYSCKPRKYSQKLGPTTFEGLGTPLGLHTESTWKMSTHAHCPVRWRVEAMIVARTEVYRAKVESWVVSTSLNAITVVWMQLITFIAVADSKKNTWKLQMNEIHVGKINIWNRFKLLSSISCLLDQFLALEVVPNMRTEKFPHKKWNPFYLLNTAFTHRSTMHHLTIGWTDLKSHISHINNHDCFLMDTQVRCVLGLPESQWHERQATNDAERIRRDFWNVLNLSLQIHPSLHQRF